MEDSEVDYSRLPADLSPLNLKAYCFNAFNACGCSEMAEMLEEVKRLLEWHDSDDREKYMQLYPGHLGVFYLLCGLLDDLGLTEHGTSIRHPWLMSEGKQLLEALRMYSVQEIEKAYGEAYDGCHYDEG